ncbi:DDE domain transposase [Moorena producens 3L]|uniref:DDE domain transposase n=1 Tax=Moorena producens 3L TaxID=489825 RepID=F4Y1U4_9CYAN|nr:DDE domain transposase [Moorena producens 3L]OLT64479.1 IS5 family transposase [Moorena producens 3L]
MFKKSKTNLSVKTKCLADQGYQGIQKIHKMSHIPHKKPPKSKLSPLQKEENRQLASQRIVIEHVYRNIKIFKIFSERYRNRRKRFGLRFNLIAAIYNYELCLLAKPVRRTKKKFSDRYFCKRSTIYQQMVWFTLCSGVI